MKVSRTRLANVVAQKALQPISAKQLGQEIAAYLLNEGRTGELDSLMRDVMQYRAEHGIVEAIAVSAHQLTASNRSDVEAEIRSLYPSARQVIISEERDPDLLGGIKIELANQQFDASLRSKLNRFKRLTSVGKD